MHRLLCLFVIIASIVVGCTTEPTPEPTPDPINLLATAAANIRTMKSFRMVVEQGGANYLFPTEFGDVVFKRAQADYVAPDTMQATVRVLAAGIPVDVEVFARGADQWFRGIWTNNLWVKALFAPGFDPGALIAQETGFQAALKALLDIKLIGSDELVDGTPVYHLTGSANGPDVTALLVGLIQATGTVAVDVYVHRELTVPVRFVIVQTDTITAEQPDPTTWSVEVYDFDADIQLNNPEAQANVPEVTPEAGS